MGRMADSRAERRWSKDPRMATTRSVMVWLFWRDSLMNDALSVRVSISKGTPISLTFFFLLFQISSFFFFKEEEDEKRRESVEGCWRGKCVLITGFDSSASCQRLQVPHDRRTGFSLLGSRVRMKIPQIKSKPEKFTLN